MTVRDEMVDLSRYQPANSASRATALDAAGVLASLAAGVLVVGADWRVLFANDAAAEGLLTTTRDLVGADLRAVVPGLAAERDGMGGATATLLDGRPRTFFLEVARGDMGALLQVRVTRDPAQRLVFQLDPSPARAAAEEREENAVLRGLAQQMAELADSGALLRVLCETAWVQCDGSGAAVIMANDGRVHLDHAVGDAERLLGDRFALDETFASEVLRTRRPLVVEDLAATDRPSARRLREIGVGAMIAAPLTAHDEQLGEIAVLRPVGARPFTSREVQRLEVIAHHASLAVWKTRLLEQARAADSAKGRFLATISHELRTPLTALTGYGELLADQVIGPLSEAQLDILERMRSVTHHLSTMIEEILAFTNLESGNEVVRPSEFLAADLVAAVGVVVEPLVRQKGLDLTVAVPEEPIRVTSDIDKLRQILVNLATNAVKFTEAGTVRLAAECADGAVRFLVEDTGIGIAQPDLARLFRPFAQLDTSLTRRHGGTGLGLYVSQRLASLVGATIAVTSTPEAGSVFSLTVPTAWCA